MNKRLINESTQEYIKYCRDMMLGQREVLIDFKDAFHAHQDKTGCRELVSSKCRTCELFLEVIIENGYLQDEYNDNYRKAVSGNE